MRFAHVPRNHRHETGGDERHRAAPAAARDKRQCHRRRAREGRELPARKIQLRRRDLIEMTPRAAHRAGQERQARHGQIQVERQRRPVEEMRIEVARLHHVDDAVHHLGFVRADGVGDAGADVPQAQGGRRDHDAHRRGADTGAGPCGRRRHATRV